MGAGVRFLRSGSFRVPSSILVPNFVSNHVPSLFGYFLLLPRCRFRRLFWPFFRVWYVEGGANFEPNVRVREEASLHRGFLFDSVCFPRVAGEARSGFGCEGGCSRGRGGARAYQTLKNGQEERFLRTACAVRCPRDACRARFAPRTCGVCRTRGVCRTCGPAAHVRPVEHAALARSARIGNQTPPPSFLEKAEAFLAFARECGLCPSRDLGLLHGASLLRLSIRSRTRIRGMRVCELASKVRLAPPLP